MLALLSNLAVIGFIDWRTNDEQVAAIRSQVLEQGKVLADVYRTGGKAALDDAIDDTMAYADPQTAIALLDPHRREIKGNIASAPAAAFADPAGYRGSRNALIRLRGQTTPREAALVVQRLPNGQWLLSGRIAGEALTIRETLERSLPQARGQPEYHAFLATLMQMQGRHADAIQQYDQALRASPESGRSLAGLAISLEAEKRVPEAREAYRRALAAGGLGRDLEAFAERKLKQLQ